jgi:hypothetical protein
MPTSPPAFEQPDADSTSRNGIPPGLTFPLFHVSDAGPLAKLTPRPVGSGPHAGRTFVWAVDGVHLPNYLLPRDCPRVCWAAGDRLPGLLASPASRVICVEHAWSARLLFACLHVHELAPDGFAVLDAAAGYWVSENEVPVRSVRLVEDCFAALAEAGVELRSRGDGC